MVLNISDIYIKKLFLSLKKSTEKVKAIQNDSVTPVAGYKKQ